MGHHHQQQQQQEQQQRHYHHRNHHHHHHHNHHHHHHYHNRHRHHHHGNPAIASTTAFIFIHFSIISSFSIISAKTTPTRARSTRSFIFCVCLQGSSVRLPPC